jgi:hypothetical protein
VDKTPTDSTITWDDPPGAYNVYRGAKESGPWSYNQTCLNSGLSETSTTDTEIPAPDQLFYYFVSRVDSCNESSLGTDSAGMERPTISQCP